MKRIRLFSALVVLPTAWAQQVINFEDLVTTGNGQGGKLAVISQYENLGVQFNGPVAIDYSKGQAIPGFAHSGKVGLEHCYGKEFCTTPFNIAFTAPQARVIIWVGSSLPVYDRPRTVAMRAFDSAGQQIASQQTTLPGADVAPINTAMEVTSASAAIVRVTLSYEPRDTFANGLAIDDLEFSTVGSPPPCPATQPAVVTILQPDVYAVNVNRFLLQASIETKGGIVSALALSISGESGQSRTLNLPRTGTPDGQAVPSQIDIGPFWVPDMLFPGKNALAVRAETCAGTTIQSAREITLYPIVPDTRFELQHLEITQATQTLGNTVPLIAGKPTAVRAYLGVAGGSTLIRDVSAVLAATLPDGSRPPGPVSVRSLDSTNANASTDISAKRLQLTFSLNFRVPTEWTTAGQLHFEIVRVDISGEQSTLECSGCDNKAGRFPRFVTFFPSGRLNLVLVPYQYGSDTPDLVNARDLALQWLNNVYPLPGSFPEDRSGINIIATLPLRTTTRDLTSKEGRRALVDDLDGILHDWHVANPGTPASTRIVGLVPCMTAGCIFAGRVSGYASYVPVPRSGQSPLVWSYAGVWAHEIGHNFGRRHANDENGAEDVDKDFPYEHGGIGVPGLAITPDQLGLITPAAPFGGHTHDFMSYGSPQWVSPYTYQALFAKLRTIAFTTRTAPIEKLVISGTITPHLTVEFRPAYRVITRAMSSGGSSGEFSLRLLDRAGTVLQVHRFDAAATSQDPFGPRTFSEYVPWRDGTTRIVIEREGLVVGERRVSPNAPQIGIYSPKLAGAAGGDLFISWKATDADGDALTYSVLFKSGDGPWIPLAENLDTPSIVLNAASLQMGMKAWVRVRATDGVNSAADDCALFN